MSLHDAVYNNTPRTREEAEMIARQAEAERLSYMDVWNRNEAHYSYLCDRADYANETASMMQ